jgi:pimeloyl-ACP methyl ester carboxylesterase
MGVRFLSGWIRWSVIALAVMSVLVAAVVLAPMSTGNLEPASHPAASYEEAAQRFVVLHDAEIGPIDPSLGSILLTHGVKTDRAAVLFHGYTRNPSQMRRLGEVLFNRGYNVLIPLAPRHGYADPMTRTQEHLSAEELAGCTGKALDIAHGLGDTVLVAGFSMGGVMAAWAAQFRPDVDTAVIIAPALGLHVIPAPLTGAAAKFFLVLPNAYRWWNPAKKGLSDGSCGYPRYSTRALAGIMRLGLAVRSSARARAPLARKVIVATNPNDREVNNSQAAGLVSAWKKRGARGVAAFEIPPEPGVGHELFAPDVFDERYTRVLTVVAGLIDR